MFRSLVLLGGKVWKHKNLRPNQSRKRSHRDKMARVSDVDSWLRKYNENPHNRLPKKPKAEWQTIETEMKIDAKRILEVVEKDSKELKKSKSHSIGKALIDKSNSNLLNSNKQ